MMRQRQSSLRGVQKFATGCIPDLSAGNESLAVAQVSGRAKALASAYVRVWVSIVRHPGP